MEKEELIKQIEKVSHELRHAIVMNYSEQVVSFQKQLESLVEALRLISPTITQDNK